MSQPRNDTELLFDVEYTIRCSANVTLPDGLVWHNVRKWSIRYDELMLWFKGREEPLVINLKYHDESGRKDPVSVLVMTRDGQTVLGELE